MNLSDAVCTEFAVQIYTKQPYLSICWILEFISALFNNHTVIVQNLAFNHFQKLAVFSGEYWMQICITCSKLFRRKRRNIKRAFFVWKPRQNITTVLTTEATLLEFMIQVILYRLVYGIQGCICNKKFFTDSRRITLVSLLSRILRDRNRIKYSRLKIYSNIFEKEIKETNHKI